MMKKGQNGGRGGIPEKTRGAMEGLEWEMRPGGMLVQKRTDSSSSSYPRNSANPRSCSSSSPNIRVSVKYGSSRHEILINSHARFGKSIPSPPFLPSCYYYCYYYSSSSSSLSSNIFGTVRYGETETEELKKVLSGATGVHPQDQKLLFKDRERDSSSYLDTSGVKDGSKLVLLVRDTSFRQEKPSLQLPSRSCRGSTTTTGTGTALNSVTQVTVQVDKLAAQVTDLESVICRGGKVAEKELLTLIESFMSLLIQLDAITADGDVKSQRKMQVVRVQKYIEALDRLKAQDAILRNNRTQGGGGGLLTTYNQPKQNKHPQNQPMQIQQQQRRRNFTGLVVGTTKWENI